MSEKTSFPKSLINIAQFLSTDYLIHHKEAYRVMNDKMSDSLFALSIHKPFLWILKNNESKYLVRQVAASVYNFMRFSVSFGVSSTDLVCSKVFHAFLPQNQQFSDIASKQRFYKRMMLTLRLNGGPYKELHNIISGAMGLTLPPPFLSQFPSLKALQEANKQYPVVRRELKNNELHSIATLFSSGKQQTGETMNNEEKITLQELENLFSKQVGVRMNSVFKSIIKKPY